MNSVEISQKSNYIQATYKDIMRALIQRTSGVKLFINDKIFSESQKGLLVLFGTKENDSDQLLPKLVDKIVNLRIFEDLDGKMNLSAIDTKAELMLVSQFTLYANTSKGRRPSFNEAQNPTDAKMLYEKFVTLCRETELKISTGEFGAKMDIQFNNDGPVTIMIDLDA